MTIPSGFIPSQGKQAKYRKPPFDMSAPIKFRDVVIPVEVVDGQRIISIRAIAEAMADDKLTAQNLHALLWQEKLMWGDVRVE